MRESARSRAMLVLALLLLAATFFLISPPPGQSYPSAIPWDELSILRPLIDLMSLQGLLVSVRGVEVKDLAFHLATALGLLLLALAGTLGATPVRRSLPARLAVYAQVLLGGWVVLSMLSALWSGDPALSVGQAGLYALAFGWAVAVGGTLARRHVRPLMLGLLIISALGAVLAIWYYYERNPYHRASFPIGNPTTLAAALLPAILMAVALAGHSVWEWLRARRVQAIWGAAGAIAALVPLLWCLRLARGRGAALALAVGLATLLIFLAGRRARWLLAGVFGVLILGAGALVYHTSRLDVTMARGATIRFRLYAWRYAAHLWDTRPLLGHGAGAYPRLASTIATRDRALDPGAFMAVLVEHAHNELFEILGEIGLVGGVTFVGGFFATVLVAILVLQPRAPGPPRWVRLSLVAGIAALMADALLGVSQRLPGPPPLLFTLMGVLWAIARETSAGESEEPRAAEPAGRPSSLVLARVLCIAAALAAGWVAVRNWVAVADEYRAEVATREDRWADALAAIERAEPGLLDPVQKLKARDTALGCRYALAYEAYAACFAGGALGAASQARWTEAVGRALETYDAAIRLSATSPALRRTDVVAARAAEWLADLQRMAGDDETAIQWRRAAHSAWERQRQRTPFDVETLLALTGYPGTLPEHVAMLRDAQREAREFGPARDQWLSVLAHYAGQPGFDQVLAAFVAAVGPITADTDLDALIASMGPETYRLVAATHGLRGEYEAAVEAAGRAVSLYEPMRARFPLLYPLALAEQAEYLLRAAVGNAPQAIALLERAMAALPVIQEEKYERMLGPFRWQLAATRLASGDTEQALSLVGEMLGERAGERELVEQVLGALLADLAARGIDEEVVARSRSRLCESYPGLCAAPATRPSGGE